MIGAFVRPVWMVAVAGIIGCGGSKPEPRASEPDYPPAGVTAEEAAVARDVAEKFLNAAVAKDFDKALALLATTQSAGDSDAAILRVSLCAAIYEAERAEDIDPAYEMHGWTLASMPYRYGRKEAGYKGLIYGQHREVRFELVVGQVGDGEWRVSLLSITGRQPASRRP